MTVVRTNVEPFERVHVGATFPNGRADVVVGVLLERVECGCVVEVGIRADSLEQAMCSTPCDRHAPEWDGIQARFLADRRPSEEALEAAISALGASA